MEKIENKISLCVNIHTILKVKFCSITEEILPKLLEQFSMFTDNSSSSNQWDVIVSQLDTDMVNDLRLDLGKPHEYEQFAKNIHNLWINRYDNSTYVVIGNKGKADVAINLADPIKLFYTPRHKCWRNLFHALILCLHIALYKKNALLFHGAVMCKNDLSVVLTGPAGVGKSIFVLKMLNEGWSYLSDDLFIWLNQTAYIFRAYIPLRPYHFKLFPWLLSRYSFDKNVTKWPNLRDWVTNLAETHLPGVVLPYLEKFLSPNIIVSPTNIFPNAKLIYSAKPRALIVLSQDFNFDFKCSSKDRIIKDIMTINSFDFPEFERLGRLIHLYGYGSEYDIGKLIDSNIKNLILFKMTVPYDPDIDLLYQNFKQHLMKELPQ